MTLDITLGDPGRNLTDISPGISGENFREYSIVKLKLVELEGFLSRIAVFDIFITCGYLRKKWIFSGWKV